MQGSQPAGESALQYSFACLVHSIAPLNNMNCDVFFLKNLSWYVYGFRQYMFMDLLTHKKKNTIKMKHICLDSLGGF